MTLAQLTMPGSPLYSELCVGLCRAFAGAWLRAGAAGDVTTVRSGGQTARSAWRLIDSCRADHGAIHATSLVDLRQTVRDLRRMSDDAIAAEDASPAIALD